MLNRLKVIYSVVAGFPDPSHNGPTTGLLEW